MKHLTFTLVMFFLLASSANSQQIMVESGKSITSLTFSDFQSTSLGNIQSTTQNYISFGYRKRAIKDILYFIAGSGVHSYGAMSSDNNQNFYEWATTYLSIYTGLEVKMLKFEGLEFSLRLRASPEFIIQGAQTLNNQVFNLVGEEDFDKANLFLRGGVMVEYGLIYAMSLFVQYKYGVSTQLANPSLDNRGKLQFQAHDIGFGVIINLDSKESRKFRKKVKKSNNRNTN